MTTRRQPTSATPTLRLTGGEGASSSGQGAALKLSEAQGSAHGSGKAVSHIVHGGHHWRRIGETVIHRSGQGTLAWMKCNGGGFLL
jgi:hypothetical protein